MTLKWPTVKDMGQSKRRQKATPPPLRSDLRPKEVPLEVLHAHLDRAHEVLGDEGYADLRMAVDTLAFVNEEVERKDTSVLRLRHLLFGPKTESFAATCREAMKAENPPATGTPAPPKEPRKKAPGHGRNGAAAYPGAKRIPVPLEGEASGGPCPECPKGKVYPMKDPVPLLRVKGVAPFMATIYELERRRCNLCGEVFTAEAPAGVGQEKYDESVGAMLGLLRYGACLPMNRIEKLQAGFGIPMPASTQWEILLKAAGLLAPAHAELVRQAAQGEVLFNDDTVMRILGKAPQAKEGRKAVYTSAILSRIGSNRIALFITGHNHAGENLGAVLEQRDENLPAPIQMCDALAANTVGEAGELNTILAHCLAHARRRFVEVETRFPEEVQHLLGELKAVYQNDARAKQEQLDPQARLMFHQLESAPIMAGLERWLREQIEEGKVEPNSGLGQAISYMRKHWTPLTLFLREPGCPLDNNLCYAAHGIT
jgi:hypothetical protein